MKPLIYFSYGMTKSGSTLAYELARSALVLAGLEQPRLSLAAVTNRKKINFIAHVDDPQANAIRNEVASIGHTIAIKTHTRPDPQIVEMLEKGEAFGHAIYRDPRDMALSMLDHGERARAAGKPAFAEYVAVEDTIENIAHQTNTLRAWLSLPGVIPLYYDDFAFDIDATTARIMAELGINADIDATIRMATVERFTQLNKGVAARHNDEMAPAISATFKEIFAPLYDTLITHRAALPRDGRPALAADAPLCRWDLVTARTATGETS